MRSVDYNKYKFLDDILVVMSYSWGFTCNIPKVCKQVADYTLLPIICPDSLHYCISRFII